MEKRTMKLASANAPGVFLRIIPGHFVTNHSHINYYVNMTTLKSRTSEAQNAAKIIAAGIPLNTIVDTIICMDGTEVIGTFLADQLRTAGIHSINEHRSIYVVSPETDSSGQIIFRDSNKFMVENKNVLILLATATTGITLERSLTCIKYYGGKPAGIGALFSAINTAFTLPIVSLFSPKDIPNYQTYSFNEYLLCKAGMKLDAMINGYGYSKL